MGTYATKLGAVLVWKRMNPAKKPKAATVAMFGMRIVRGAVGVRR